MTAALPGPDDWRTPEVAELLVPLAHPHAEIVWITPEVAAALLRQSNWNRDSRGPEVRSLIASANEDGWFPGVGTVQQDIRGQIQDGGHRLAMTVELGRPVALLLVRGMPPEAQHVTDTGLRRSAADALRLSRRVEANASTVQAIARIAIIRAEGGHRLVRDQVNGIRKVRNPEILRWVDDNLDALDAAAFARLVGPRLRAYLPPSAIGYAYWVLARIDPAQAQLFLWDLAERKSQGTGDPITAVGRAYDDYKTIGVKPRITGHLFILFTAWNARVTGRRLTKISPRPDPDVHPPQYQTVPDPVGRA